jgi:acetyl-CoA synthetase
MPPTALKLMRDAPGDRLDIRSVASGGEPLGEALLEWGRARFGKTINEFYGQTECNLVVGQSGDWRMKPGSMGRPIPGHEVAVVNEAGAIMRPDELGTIAIRRPDPVMFLGYWNRPEATAEKFAGDWLLTGDQGRMDADGFLWFVGRDDDVITSAGYRIGPGELEECLLRHPAVALAAVVGLPDELRTERVAAFVVLRTGVEPDQALATELQAFVKDRVAAHAYPREIRFRDSLPMTTTGKIMRRVLRDEG